LVSQVQELQQELATGKQEQSQVYRLVPGSIYDGEPLRVSDGFQQIKIRLCGIDAPEKDQPMGMVSRAPLRSHLILHFIIKLL